MNGLRIAFVREQVLMISKVPEMSVESRESQLVHEEILGYRIDLVIEVGLPGNFKSLDTILPIPHSQLLTYLRLRRFCVGLLININTRLLPGAIIRRII